MHPSLFHFGHLYLPTFGALAALGLVAALSLSERTARLRGLPPQAVWDAGIAAVVSAFVLSRLLLLAANFRTFAQYPVLLLTVPSLTPLAVALTLLATLAWLRIKRLPLRAVLDAWAPCATLVWAALALGHFAEGSDLGMPARLGLQPPGASTPLAPVALYTALAAAGLTLLLYRRLSPALLPGRLAGAALALAGLAQFLLSFLRQPAPAPLAQLDPLEWTSLAMGLAGTILLLTPHNKVTALPNLSPGP